MGLIQLIGVFLFSSAAAMVIAGFQRSRQKQGAPAPFQTPLVPAGTRIPVVFGTWRVRPIITWFGGSTTTTVIVYDTPLLFGFIHFAPTGATKAGYEYGVTAQGVLCWGKAYVFNIIFGEHKTLTSQEATQTVGDPTGVSQITLPTVAPVDFTFFDPFLPSVLDLEVYRGGRATQTIFLPNVYGGPGRGGGVKGKITFAMGSRQYGPDPLMVARLGDGNVPSYADLATVVYDNLIMGEVPTPNSIDYIIRSQGAPINSRMVGPAGHQWLVEDTSASDIFRLGVQHPWWGNSEDDWKIDSDSFADAHTTLFNEKNGMSLYAGGSSGPQIASVQQLREECEKHAGGLMRRNEQTFKWEFKLLRDESANYANLQQVNENHIRSIDWHRSEPAEVVNSVTLEYSDAAQLYQVDTVTLKNDANIAQTRTVRPSKVSYLGCTDRELAWKLCARELKQQSTPLGRGQIKTTRELWSALPGDVIRLSNVEHELDNVLVRVMAVDLGLPEDGEITVTIVEDVFTHPDITRLDNPAQPDTIIPSIVRPTITAMKTTVVDGVGTLDVTILDPEHRITSIAFATKEGNAAPSAYANIATGTADTSDPTFPYNNHVTSDDLNGTYSTTVNLSTQGPSAIAVRIRYIAYSTIADPLSDIQEINQIADFPKLDSPEAAFDIFATLDVVLDASRVPTATATITKGTAIRVKFAISTAGTPSDATVRAQTSVTSPPWEKIFAAIGNGQTAYVAAFAYDVAGNESNKATDSVTAPGRDTTADPILSLLPGVNMFSDIAGTIAASSADPLGMWKDSRGNGNNIHGALSTLRAERAGDAMRTGTTVGSPFNRTQMQFSVPNFGAGSTLTECEIWIRIKSAGGVDECIWNLTPSSGSTPTNLYPSAAGHIEEGAFRTGGGARVDAGVPIASLTVYRTYKVRVASTEFSQWLDGLLQHSMVPGAAIAFAVLVPWIGEDALGAHQLHADIDMLHIFPQLLNTPQTDSWEEFYSGVTSTPPFIGSGSGGALSVDLTFDVSGGDVLVTATSTDADSVKIVATTSPTAAPSDAAVRAATALTTRPFVAVFPAPAANETLHVAAFAYDGATESTPKATLDIPGSSSPIVDDAGVGTPTLIESGESFIVPTNRQVLFAVPIVVEGILIVNGVLISVN